MILQNSVVNDAHLTELFDFETWLANDATSLALMHQKTKVHIFTTAAAAAATRSWPSRCLDLRKWINKFTLMMPVVNPKHTVRPNKTTQPLNSSIKWLSYAGTIHFLATIPSHLLLATWYPHSPSPNCSLGSAKSFARCYTHWCNTYKECSHYRKCCANMDGNLHIHEQFMRNKFYSRQ